MGTLSSNTISQLAGFAAERLSGWRIYVSDPNEPETLNPRP